MLQIFVNANYDFVGRRRWFYLVSGGFVVLSLVSIPNYRPAVLLTMQTETQRRLVIAGIALKRYQLQHGRFPERLDALAPAFVAGTLVQFIRRSFWRFPDASLCSEFLKGTAKTPRTPRRRSVSADYLRY